MGLQAHFYTWKKPKDEGVKPASQESIVRDLRPEVILLLVEPDEVSNENDFRSLIDTWSRSTSEALAEALGLASAYGEDNPDEPGDYLPSPVDAEKIDWEKLANLEGCEWHPGVTVEEIRDLVAKGYSFEFSPSY